MIPVVISYLNLPTTNNFIIKEKIWLALLKWLFYTWNKRKKRKNSKASMHCWLLHACMHAIWFFSSFSPRYV